MRTELYSAFVVSMAVVSLLLPAGCAPVISQQTLAEVDQGLSFEQLSRNPEAYKGKVVLLGGDIIGIGNSSERTEITVLQRPLGFRNKPTGEDISRGRFIVYVPGFLDPAIYHPGRKITIVGAILGREVRPLGEIEYGYPVIGKKELYLWPAGKHFPVHFGFAVGTGF
jgi:outer membrane lipoprotein